MNIFEKATTSGDTRNLSNKLDKLSIRAEEKIETRPISMSIPQEIKNLIDRFNENQASYFASTYNEMQLRQEFLNPFFEALLKMTE